MSEHNARKTPDYSHLIGEVVSPFASRAPVTFSELRPSLVEESRAGVFEAVLKLLNATDSGDLVLSPRQAAALSRENLRVLQQKGVIAVRYDVQHTLGAYAMNAVAPSDDFSQAIDPEPTDLLDQNDFLVLRKGFKGKFGLNTLPPKNMSPDQIKNAAFEKIPTTAQVISICSKNQEGKWEWGPSEVYPDGDHVLPPLTAAVHYAQSCFEGLAVMVNESGEVTLFRAEDNARRIIESCKALCIPAMDERQIVASIEAAVMANKSFLPPAGSNAKLYVRPFMIGLGGGTSAGIGLPDSYMFGVEVFPFGDYIGKRDSIVHTVVGDRERCVKGNGSVKGAQNYPGTVGPKLKAKHDGFGEVVYFRQVVQAQDGEKAPVVRDVLDEASAANVFFSSVKGDKVTLYTPSLDRGTILPGITRATVISLAKTLGYEVVEREISPEDIQNMDGAFFSGTAAGLVRVGSMTLKDGRKDFDQASEGESATKATEVFFALYDHLYKARRGELDPIKFPQVACWARKIGRVPA